MGNGTVLSLIKKFCNISRGQDTSAEHSCITVSINNKKLFLIKKQKFLYQLSYV